VGCRADRGRVAGQDAINRAARADTELGEGLAVELGSGGAFGQALG